MEIYGHNKRANPILRGAYAPALPPGGGVRRKKALKQKFGGIEQKSPKNALISQALRTFIFRMTSIFCATR